MFRCVFKIEKILGKEFIICTLYGLQCTKFLCVPKRFDKVLADFILLFIIGNTLTGKSINSVAFFTYRKVIEYTLC